jgi:hypothetical protein
MTSQDSQRPQQQEYGQSWAIVIVRSLGEDEVDLSRYEMQVPGWYDRFRKAQMNDWLLYLVAEEGV